MYNEKYTVAIVGRPNVGKSTLFNKIVKKRVAIVSDYAGVTRDRNFATVCHNEKEFILVDTGGFIEDKNELQDKLNEQTKIAIDDADTVIFVLDAKSGINPDDFYFANYLRKCNKKVLLVANKSETKINKLKAEEFHELGMGEPMLISSEHNLNIVSLKDQIVGDFNIAETTSLSDGKNVVFALIGKPNTGKSTLTNKLLGSKKVITSAQAGTTRDSIAHDLHHYGRDYTIIDTAGIRRKTKIKCEIEKFSVIRSLNTITNANVVVYLIAADEMISDQDMKLINFIIDEGKSLIIAINKCDLLSKQELKIFTDAIKEKLEFAYFAIIINISAKTGHGINLLWRSIYNAYNTSMTKFSTKKLTEILRLATSKNPPSVSSGRFSKMHLAHPGGNNPPTIIIHGKQTDKLTNQYKRYLVKFFYQKLNVKGNPIKLYFKNTKNPYDN
ncbi:MAG: ribosome biogenesis GTPase Der [Pseudomonadota bacterium]|nr:ribosome biogenesis GTPase Der [Pseudomonadota bacterium]